MAKKKLKRGHELFFYITGVAWNIFDIYVIFLEATKYVKFNKNTHNFF